MRLYFDLEGNEVREYEKRNAGTLVPGHSFYWDIYRKFCYD